MTNLADAAASAELVSSGPPSLAWFGRALGLTAVALALLSALVTFLVLAGLTPIAPTHEVVVSLLLANAATVLLLTLVIGREVWRVVQARRRGRAAARLHVRIVALFSVIAAVPAVLVAVVASVTLDRGLDRLFSRQTHTMIENSLMVADAYVREHVQFVRADSVAIAVELARAKPLFDQSREQFHFISFCRRRPRSAGFLPCSSSTRTSTSLIRQKGRSIRHL
jgi:two-component system nitrogen regulation sensor histidine kinase NtrY